MNINFNNKKLKQQYKDMLTSLFNTTIKKVGIKEKDIEVGFELVSRSNIKKINYKFRDKNAVTDVLSFPTLELKPEGVSELATTVIKDNYKTDINYATGNLYIGDVLVCYKVAKKQAKEYDNSIQRELGYLFVHGLLHLLGYDHETETDKKAMRKMEEKILKANDLQRV